MDRGKILIASMLLAAASASAFAIWYRGQHVRRVIPTFSPEAASLIANASLAELWRIEPSDDEQPEDDHHIRIQGTVYRITQRKSGDGAKAFAKLRAWLLHDDNYDWSAPPNNRPNRWQYAIRLREGERQLVVAVDLDAAEMVLLPAGNRVSVAPMVEGLVSYFQEQLAPRADR